MEKHCKELNEIKKIGAQKYLWEERVKNESVNFCPTEKVKAYFNITENAL